MKRIKLLSDLLDQVRKIHFRKLYREIESAAIIYEDGNLEVEVKYKEK
jgi:hypothetical protein